MDKNVLVGIVVKKGHKRTNSMSGARKIAEKYLKKIEGKMTEKGGAYRAWAFPKGSWDDRGMYRQVVDRYVTLIWGRWMKKEKGGMQDA